MDGPLSVAGRGRFGAFSLDVAFEAPAAGVTALFGRSGAGKSLTLGMIAGAVRPAQGRIAAGARVLFDRAAGIDLPMERRRIGWVFQDARLFPHLSVARNLAYGAQRAGGLDASAFQAAVGVLGLERLLERRPRDLSGGERQRVAVGRALLARPDVLLMDEPLSALDQARKQEVLPYLERLKAEARIPIVYVTHALSEVVRLADRLVVLEAGRVTAQGPLAEVLASGEAPAMAGRSDAAAVLEGRVGAHAGALTAVDCAGARLLTPRLDAPPGAAVRLVVLARDVLLALHEPRGLSARNVLAGQLLDLKPRADGTVLARVQLEAGPVVLAAITEDAAQSLDLRPGVGVWAVVKSVAVEGARGGLLALFDE